MRFGIHVLGNLPLKLLVHYDLRVPFWDRIGKEENDRGVGREVQFRYHPSASFESDGTSSKMSVKEKRREDQGIGCAIVSRTEGKLLRGTFAFPIYCGGVAGSPQEASFAT